MAAKLLSVLVLLLFATARVQASNPQDCPVGYTKFGTYCYAYVDHKMTWMDAESTCAALGGFLAEILTKDQGDFLHNFVKDRGSHSVWLGGNDLLREGLWMWVTSGKLVDGHYTDWHHGKPDNNLEHDENCLEMDFHNYKGEWNEEECDHGNRFVCQRQPGNLIAVG